MADSIEFRAFGNVLPKETVEVLVAASLPRVMGIGEITDNASGFFDVLVGVELSPIVEGYRFKEPRLLRDDFDNRFGR